MTTDTPRTVHDSPAGQTSEPVRFELPLAIEELGLFSSPALYSQHGQDPVVFGSKLFRAVFQKGVADLFARSQAKAEMLDVGLRLRLRLNDVPELAELPWEFLYDPTKQRFLALSDQTPIVRFLEFPHAVEPLPTSLPLRILVIASTPDDLEELDVEGEWQRLRMALDSLVRNGTVVLERLDGARLSTLQQRLRQQEFHVIHFMGHGAYDPLGGAGTLFFEFEDGRADAVSADELGVLLHDHESMRFAFLNTCASAHGGMSDAFSGVAQRLAQQGIPAVVAMQFYVTDRTAIALAQECYSALADGSPIDVAVTEARKYVYTQVDKTEWATPVLYMRVPDGRLLDFRTPADPAPAVENWRQRLREGFTLRRIGFGVWGIIGVAAMLLGFYSDIITLFDPASQPSVPTTIPLQSPPAPLSPVLPPRKMSGDFNIAVAAFGKRTEAGLTESPRGLALAEELFNPLLERFEEQDDLYVIEFRGPAEVNAVVGIDDTELMLNAEETARIHGADLLIYGMLIVDGDQTMLAPRFFLSDIQLVNAKEVAGHYTFGTETVVDGVIDEYVSTNQEMRDGIARQAAVISDFVIALSAVGLNRYPQAATHLERANTTGLGGEVLGGAIQFFLGTTAANLGDLPAAKHYYSEAYALNSEMFRAGLGQAQARFILAYGRCEKESINAEEVEQALKDYEEVLASYNKVLDGATQSADRERLYSMHIPMKVNFYRGQALLCLSRAVEKKQSWAAAKQSLEAVIEEGAENPQVADLVGEAWSVLGELHLINSNNPVTGRTEALAAYANAETYSGKPNRKAIFALSQAQILIDFAECTAANEKISEADLNYKQHREMNDDLIDQLFEQKRQDVGQLWMEECNDADQQQTNVQENIFHSEALDHRLFDDRLCRMQFQPSVA